MPKSPLALSILLAALTATLPRLAHACGCFAAPNPAVPVVQAGEKIVFAQQGDTVAAHIQIQYEGDAEEFGWLIPVPAVPELRLGAEELFAVLEDSTNPTFLFTQGNQFCGAGFGCGEAGDDSAQASAAPNARPPGGPGRVLIAESTAGPFEYAVVDAANKQPMLDWLRNNRYVVPAGGDALLDPYIHEGAYFLALKLRSGQTTGDLQPIVIEYEADRPMIPLILTALGATPDMGVLVFVLGDDRAVPLNYRHVELNEAYIDWAAGAANYPEVVARAVDEAEDGHAFVTEYAGPTAPVVGQLDAPNRFGRRDAFEETTDAIAYVRRLQDPALGFPAPALRPILERAFPMPQAAIANRIDPDQYYGELSSFLGVYDPQPEGFDPVALTAEIWERVVEPTVAAGALLRRHPYTTRLYTAVSPDEMTADPVFAFNPDLPQVSNVHSATMLRRCEPDDDRYPWRMTLSDGRQYDLADPSDWRIRGAEGAPRTTVIQTIGMEGPPIVEVDNRSLLALLSGLPDDGGCRSVGRTRWTALFNFAVFLLSVALMRRHLRR